MSTEITDYDTSEYLENEQDIIAYLNAIAGRGARKPLQKPQQGRKPQLPDHRQGNPRPRRTPHHPSRLKKTKHRQE